MAKSNNKTNYEILSQKELKDKKIPFTAIPNELIELGVKYDSSHFFVISYILTKSNSKKFKISIEKISKELRKKKKKVGKILNNLIEEGYLKREGHFESGRRKGFVYTIFNKL